MLSPVECSERGLASDFLCYGSALNVETQTGFCVDSLVVWPHVCLTAFSILYRRRISFVDVGSICEMLHEISGFGSRVICSVLATDF